MFAVQILDKVGSPVDTPDVRFSSRDLAQEIAEALTALDGEPRRATYCPDRFGFIHRFMFHSSPEAKTIRFSDHLELMALADGYGRRSQLELQQSGRSWDWSHVRDSSDEALDRIFTRLQELMRVRVSPFPQERRSSD